MHTGLLEQAFVQSCVLVVGIGQPLALDSLDRRVANGSGVGLGAETLVAPAADIDNEWLRGIRPLGLNPCGPHLPAS